MLQGPWPTAVPTQVGLLDRGDGLYLGSYTVALAGEYTLAVTLRGGHARGSPLRIHAAAGAVHAARCVADGAGVGAGFKGQTATFYVHSRDAFGNAVSKPAPQLFHVRVRPPLSAVRAPDVRVTDTGDGSCVCEWVPTVRGERARAPPAATAPPPPAPARPVVSPRAARQAGISSRSRSTARRSRAATSCAWWPSACGCSEAEWVGYIA